MEEQIRQENKMGVMPVRKLLITMSLPIMISMLIQALYNVVDSIFVARISESALAAVSLAFPIQQLMIAVSVGTGVGINALLSRKLGEKKFDDANAVAVNGMFLGLIGGAVFALFGILFAESFLLLFSDDLEVVRMGAQYLSIVTIFSFGSFLQMTCERIMQATGNTVFSMYTQGAGALINLILDPILIFGLFGLPAMGVVGAAVATVTGQIGAMFLGVYLNHVKNKEIHMHYRRFRPNGAIIKSIYKVGVPSIIMQSIMSVMTMGMNKILVIFSPAGSTVSVSIMGIYFKLQSFVFMPVFGLTNGLIPVVSYNFGARKKERIVGVIKFALLLSVSIMVMGTLLFQLAPELLVRMFYDSPEMLGQGVPALRIISSCFLFAGIGIVFSSVFQALGDALFSLIMSVTRQLVVILPVAFLLARFVGLGVVWFAFPIAELVSLMLAILMFIRVYKQRIQYLDVPLKN